MVSRAFFSNEHSYYFFSAILFNVIITVTTTVVPLTATTNFPIKLTSSNFPVWKCQVHSPLVGLGLDAYVDGAVQTPDQFLDTAKTQPNPCYTICVVESVGEGVRDLKAGDKVVAVFNGECGSCKYCESSKTNLCEKFRVDPGRSVMVGDGKCRFSTKDDKPIYHFLNTSTFSQYTVINSACVAKIDPIAPLKNMTLLSCGVSSGVGAVWNTADVQAGETVAVFGMGAVGLAVVEGARVRGASKIIAVDINSDKRIKGEAIGITHFINPKEIDKPVHQEIREMTGGGVNYSFECAGNVDVLREAFLSTIDGWGLTVMLGIHPSPRMLPFHPMELFDGRRIVASVFGDFKGKSQLPNLVKRCMEGVVKLDEFITHEMPFANINEAFQLLVDGKSLRCLLHL
ncbi:unnamed protein product [Cuscuta europaea]|uniref:Alcohol dehydrogenase n=1 Tax=Cuscuta europaea TaxID=41803 RepID=A0A9P1DZZ0_CUSEU|nr:unnamed protein product [Cuscuta europaea]